MQYSDESRDQNMYVQHLSPVVHQPPSRVPLRFVSVLSTPSCLVGLLIYSTLLIFIPDVPLLLDAIMQMKDVFGHGIGQYTRSEVFDR